MHQEIPKATRAWGRFGRPDADGGTRHGVVWGSAPQVGTLLASPDPAPAAPHRAPRGGLRNRKHPARQQQPHDIVPHWVTEVNKQVVRYGINTLRVSVLFLHQIQRSVSVCCVG